MLSFTFAVSLLAGVVFSQGPTTNLSYSLVAIGGPDTPQQGISLLNQWCTGQRSTCGTLCGGTNGGTASNNCTASTLAYSCTCNNNGSAPDSLPYYAVSIPAFTCQALKAACIVANDNDQTGQAGCNTSYVCGSNAIANFTPPTSASSMSSSMASTASPSGTTAPSGTGTGGSGSGTTTSAAATSPTHNAAAQHLAAYGNGVGLAALAAGVVGGFAFVF